MFNKKLKERIRILEDSVASIKLPRSLCIQKYETVRLRHSEPDCKFDHGGFYKDVSLREVIEKSDKEIKKLKGIVAELTDYVYREKK